MSYQHQMSTGAGRLDNSHTADMAHLTWPSAALPSSPSNTQDDLIKHIDSHLAWQDSDPLPWDPRPFVHTFHAYQAHAASRELRRRGSAGTLVVDWDGSGEGQAYFRGQLNRSYRQSAVPTQEQQQQQQQQPRRISEGVTTPGRHESAADRSEHKVVDSRPPPLPDFLTATYAPMRNTVSGYDPSTRLVYDYNGHVMHVSRRSRCRRRPRSLASSYTANSHSYTHASPSHSEVSEYFALPVESYASGVPFRVCQNAGSRRDKDLPALPVKGKVVAFVEKVMRKLDGSGVLGRMRRKRARERKNAGLDLKNL